MNRIQTRIEKLEDRVATKKTLGPNIDRVTIPMPDFAAELRSLEFHRFGFSLEKIDPVPDEPREPFDPAHPKKFFQGILEESNQHTEMMQRLEVLEPQGRAKQAQRLGYRVIYPGAGYCRRGVGP